VAAGDSVAPATEDIVIEAEWAPEDFADVILEAECDKD
jgi:hypothetical protein